MIMKNNYWELVKHLALREIKARYKQSFLGFFWVVLNPLLQMIILSVIFSQIIRTDSLGIPYPIYLYTGLLPWNFFSIALGTSLGVLVENAPLLKKIYFPREILVLSVIIAKLIDFLFSVVIFLILMVWFHVPFSPIMLLFIPIFIIQCIFMFGLGLLLSSLNLLYRDIQYLFNLVIILWFYLTPIIYATELLPAHYQWIFKINPLAVFIMSYRDVLLLGKFPNMGNLALATAISVIIFILSFKLFKRLEGMFADVV